MVKNDKLQEIRKRIKDNYFLKAQEVYLGLIGGDEGTFNERFNKVFAESLEEEFARGMEAINPIVNLNKNDMAITAFLKELGYSKIPADTTPEQWEDYRMQYENFHAKMDNKFAFAKRIFDLIETYNKETAERITMEDLSKERSLDAPNKPGYYRANND
jgi:hypothetical protein